MNPAIRRLCGACLVLSIATIGANGRADEFAARVSDTASPLPVEISLSIEAAVLGGLENSPDLHIRKLQPEVLGAFEQLARGTFGPEVSADFEYGREESSEVSRSTEDQFSVTGSDISGSAGIRQTLPTGTTVETTVGVTRAESSRTPTQNQTRVGVDLTQQLLRGLSPRVNLAEIRLAELDTRADRYELTAFAEALVASIETAYWRYVGAVEAVVAVEQALAAAEAQLAVVETRIEVGALPENERALASAEVAVRKQSLIDAVALRDAARYRLLGAVYFNRPIHRVETLHAVTAPRTPEVISVNAESSISLALQSRPELAEASLRIDQGNLQVEVTRNGLLPKLELFIGVGKSGYAESFSGSIADVAGPNYDFNAGLRLRHLLGNRAAKAKQRIALAERNQAEEALLNLKSVIRTDVLLAVTEVKRAHAQVAATALSVRFREQTLEAAQAKFEAGAGTMLAVTLAERDLLESRIEKIKAEAAYRIAETAQYLAEGTLLKRRGLSVMP